MWSSVVPISIVLRHLGTGLESRSHHLNVGASAKVSVAPLSLHEEDSLRGRWPPSCCCLAPAAFAAPEDGLDLSTADRCDFLDPAVCLYPFPNDHFTNGTGRGPSAQPAPRVDAGERRSASTVDPSAWNRNDGFSPGQLIVTKVPGLDTPEAFRKTRAVPVTDMWQSFRPRAPIVVIDADTGKRQLIWSELDANADSPEDVVLQIRPGRNLREGHRYIVALRNLKDADGNTIPAQQGVPDLPRQADDRRAGDRGPARPLRVDLRDARGRGDQAQAASTWPGTSRSRASRTCPSGCSRSATTPSASSATRTWATSRSRATARRSS